MLATGGERRDGCAVVVALSEQYFVFLTTIFFMGNLADHFEAFFIGFGS